MQADDGALRADGVAAVRVVRAPAAGGRAVSLPYYGMDGEPIDRLEWLARFESDRLLAQETVREGILVSTVWLGIDHSWGRYDAPLIFETMVFASRTEVGVGPELDVRRYTTKTEALAGHAELVAKWS